MWNLVFVNVLLDVKSYGCEGDGFARPPAYTLEGEDSVGIVGEGFVLQGVRISGWDGMDKGEERFLP